MNNDEQKSFTEETLRVFLNAHGVDTSEWGTGTFKSVKKLLHEIQEGEIKLVEGTDGKLERLVNSCSADVFYTDETGTLWKLKEERRVMTSGAIKIMTHKESVRGKRKEEEEPQKTMEREIAEELGISPGGYAIRFLEMRNHAGVSTNYPTLFSRFIQYHFEVILKKESFNPDGYVERQPDYAIYFVWQKKV